MKGFGYWGNQDNRDGFAGYSLRLLGGMVAYDAPLGPETRIGAGFGYARGSIVGYEGLGVTNDMNTYRLTAYLAHEPGQWFFNGDFSVGINNFNGNRQVPATFLGAAKTLQSNYTGQDYTGFAKAGYHFLAQGFTITPFASLQYSHVNTSGYTETGGDILNLKVEAQSYDLLESALGLQLARPFAYNKGVLVPEVHGKWYHELINPTLLNIVSFEQGSPSTATRGYRTADDLFNVGVGVKLLSCGCTASNWSLEAVYDYDWRSDGYRAHQGMIRFTHRL